MVILKPLMSVYLRSACGNIEAFDECIFEVSMW